jgi:hypothetical protein
MGQKVTKGLGNKYQAHKIFERQALEKFKQSKEFDKLPSVILTKEEHQEISNALALSPSMEDPRAQKSGRSSDSRSIAQDLQRSVQEKISPLARNHRKATPLGLTKAQRNYENHCSIDVQGTPCPGGR